MLGKVAAVAFALLILLAPVASAQSRVTQTELNVSGEGATSDPSTGTEAGESAIGFVNLEYCYTGPGLNPNNGKVHAAIEITGPEWVTVSPVEGVSWTPPSTEPSQQKQCKPEKVQVNFRLAEDAPPGESGELNVVVTVTEDEELAQSTYASVAGEETTTIPVAVKVPEVDPVTGMAPGATNTTEPPSDTTEESPALGPMVVMLSIVAFAALRRRL